MNAVPRLYQGDPPRRIVPPQWTIATLVSIASIILLVYGGWMVVTDCRNAALECREAARELRHERELNEAARKEFLTRVMSIILNVEEKKHGD